MARLPRFARVPLGPIRLGADANRNNEFSYADDMKGFKCPFSAHIRRINPRDALKDDIVDVNIHKFLRRGTNYGSPLPDGVLEDDGAERGGVFLLIGAHQQRQFESVQSEYCFMPGLRALQWLARLGEHAE